MGRIAECIVWLEKNSAKKINRPLNIGLVSLLLASGYGGFIPLNQIEHVPGCSPIISEVPPSEDFLNIVHQVMSAQSIIVNSNPLSETLPLQNINYDVLSPDEFNRQVFGESNFPLKEKIPFEQTAWTSDERGNRTLLINGNHLTDIGVSHIDGLSRVCDFARLLMEVTARNIEASATTTQPNYKYHMKFGNTSLRLRPGIGLNYSINKISPEGFTTTNSSSFSRGISLILAENLVHSPAIMDQYSFLADPNLIYSVLTPRQRIEYDANKNILSFLKELTPEALLQTNIKHGPIGVIDLLAQSYRKLYHEDYAIKLTGTYPHKTRNSVLA